MQIMKKTSTSKSQNKKEITIKESEKSTDQKRMDESLATERSFLRQVIDTVPAFICVKTEAGPYALANKSLAKAYGTIVSGVEGKSDLDFSPTPEEAAAFRKDDLEVIHSQKTKTIAEEMITYADGTVHWLSTTKIPVIDPDGSCSKVLAVAMDITELRNHREHLQELVEKRTTELTASQASLIEAQAVARMGSWEYDAIGDGIKGSEEFYRLFDVAPKDITRLSQFAGRLHPDDRERVQCDVADALKQNRPYDTDYRVKMGDGGWRNINARGRVFTDTAGKTVSMVGTCLDITDRKLAEEALKVSNERFLFATEGANIGIWNWDLVSDELIFSNLCKALFGIPPEEEISYQRFSEALHPDDRLKTDLAVKDALDNHKEYEIEYRSLWPDGSIHWISSKGRGYYDANGRATRMEGVVQNIAERKLAEEQLRNSSKELEQKVKELDKAITDLKRSNQELEQFAYVASHDLQEPLRMVSSYTQLLERRYKDKLDQDATDFINYAVDGANRMQRLINDLLDFSRVTTKGKPLVKLDLSAVLGQAIANLHNKIQETGSMIVNEDLPFAYGDEGQLVRVFQNLLDNAMKFKGEVSPRINVSSKTLEDKVEISISDNGIGIDKIYSERVFTIFQRLHTKAYYPGTGIGLAICKRTIERHGGTIWFESETGKGTTFYFTLNIK